MKGNIQSINSVDFTQMVRSGSWKNLQGHFWIHREALDETEMSPYLNIVLKHYYFIMTQSLLIIFTMFIKETKLQYSWKRKIARKQICLFIYLFMMKWSS